MLTTTTDVTLNYRSDQKDKDFYLVVKPAGPLYGLLMILPGLNKTPEELYAETDLPALASERGFLVVIPFYDRHTLSVETGFFLWLDEIVKEVFREYKISKQRFILGGHFTGGNGALIYAARAFQNGSRKLFRPCGVFAVDSALDMKRWWTSLNYIFQSDQLDERVNEAGLLLQRLWDACGGTPTQSPERFHQISAFYRDAVKGGQADYLHSLPVRFYCDPDIHWYMENGQLPYEHLNASDLSACIATLRKNGHRHASLITNMGRGHLQDGRPYPGAFNQVDASEFLQWSESLFVNR